MVLPVWLTRSEACSRKAGEADEVVTPGAVQKLVPLVNAPVVDVRDGMAVGEVDAHHHALLQCLDDPELAFLVMPLEPDGGPVSADDLLAVVAATQLSNADVALSR